MPDFTLWCMRQEAMRGLKKSGRVVGKELRHTGDVWRVLETGVDAGAGAIDEGGLQDGLRKLGAVENMGWGAILVLSSKGRKIAGAGASSVDSTAPEDTTSEGAVSSADNPSPLSPLPDLIKLPTQNSRIPIFDLPQLLAEEDLQELAGFHALFQQDALFFRPGKNIPVEAMLSLWRLKTYVMDTDIGSCKL